MSFIPAVLTIASTAMSAVSAIQEGNAMASAEKANANLADLYATQARQSGDYEKSKIARTKAQTLATQRARYAKSGVLLTEGSPIEVMAETAAQYEMDIRATEYNTAVEEQKYKYEASYRRQMASRYKQLGYTKAAGTVLLSAGTALKGFGSKIPAGATKGAYWNQSYLDDYFSKV